MKYFLTHLLLCVGFIYSFYNDVVEADTFDYYNGGSRYNLRNNDHIGTNFHFKQEDPSPYDYKSPYENEEVPRKQEITYKKVSYLGEDKRSEPEIQRNPMFLENRMNVNNALSLI